MEYDRAINGFQWVVAFQEVCQTVQDRSARIFFLPLLALLSIGISGCSNQGDYGRHDPSLLSKTYTSTLSTAQHFLGEERDYDLPLTASEDALRTRADDLRSIPFAGVLAEVVPPSGSDGYSHVAAITENLKVDHQRFGSFVEAARKVMQIDEARANRLEGLDALTARRQLHAATERRGRNDLLIRNGIRTMRERSAKYRQTLLHLPVEQPDVPLGELQAAYEAFHEDVVQFHSEIDQRAHMKLGASSKTLKK